MCETDEPKAGDTQPCPLCEEEEEGHDGTWTYTIKEDRVFAAPPGGAMPEVTTFGEWVCSGDRQHNRKPHEPY